MKTILSTVLTLFVSVILISQEPVKEIQLSDGNKILLGSIPEKVFQKAPYSDWYTTNYDQYTPDISSISEFKKELKKYRILVFMGTWCGDSKREVPRFMKILEIADFPKEQLKIVALDQRSEFYKKSPGGEEWGLNIVRVPTFIFLKDGKEVNRIVERPVYTIEADIEAIIYKKSYVPNYAVPSKTR